MWRIFLGTDVLEQFRVGGVFGDVEGSWGLRHWRLDYGWWMGGLGGCGGGAAWVGVGRTSAPGSSARTEPRIGADDANVISQDSALNISRNLDGLTMFNTQT